MQHIRSENTSPELKVMRELRRRKIYFATHVKNIIGKPDIVFRRKRIAIFIDSDFWHGHPTRFIMPKTNYEYWSKKISGNKERDKRISKELRLKGWKVIRLWEYDIKHKFDNCLEKIAKAIYEREASIK